MIKDFYPALQSTITKMLAGINIGRLGDILDGCAGSGRDRRLHQGEPPPLSILGAD